jgi:hypothetical protein
MSLNEWFKENLAEYAKDIAGHGCSAGFPGITYYTDTCRLYDEYKEDIWQYLQDDCDSFGCEHSLSLIATFNGANQVCDDQTFKNLMVWYACERIAREYCD